MTLNQSPSSNPSIAFALSSVTNMTAADHTAIKKSADVVNRNIQMHFLWRWLGRIPAEAVNANSHHPWEKTPAFVRFKLMNSKTRNHRTESLGPKKGMGIVVQSKFFVPWRAIKIV